MLEQSLLLPDLTYGADVPPTAPFIVAIGTAVNHARLKDADLIATEPKKLAKFQEEAAYRPFFADVTGVLILDAMARVLHRSTAPDVQQSQWSWLGLQTIQDRLTEYQGGGRSDPVANAGVFFLGHNLPELGRVLAAEAAEAAVGTDFIMPANLWYSHHFAAGNLLDPYLAFMDSATRGAVSPHQFYNWMGEPWNRAQHDNPQTMPMLEQQAAMVWRVSRKLGLLNC